MYCEYVWCEQTINHRNFSRRKTIREIICVTLHTLYYYYFVKLHRSDFYNFIERTFRTFFSHYLFISQPSLRTSRSLALWGMLSRINLNYTTLSPWISILETDPFVCLSCAPPSERIQLNFMN